MTNTPWLANYPPTIPASLAPYPARTLLDYVADTVRERPSHAATWFKGADMTYATLARASDACAVALHELGVRRGDRVAIMVPNCPQFYIVELAVWKLGAILVPLNPIYTADELEHPFRQTAPDVAVILDGFYDRAKTAQAVTGVKRIIATGIEDFMPPLLRTAFRWFLAKKLGQVAHLRDGDLRLRDLLAKYDGQRPSVEPARPEDDALLLLSGGTTGTPKCVRLTHQGLVMTGLQGRAWLGDKLLPWTDTFMLPLPVFHSYAACLVQTVSFIGHNRIALIPNPRDLDDVVKSVGKVRPAAFCGVPTLYNALNNHPLVTSRKVRFDSIKLCGSGAAPLLAETKERFERITGGVIVEGWALTESCVAATVNPPWGTQKIGSVGMPLPDVLVKVVDADDPTRELPLGEVGEILLHAPQVMSGYWNDAEETATMLHPHADGRTWLHTADLGYMDTEGYLFIVDRKKDLIKAGGMQVWPREIEEALAKHPAVAEVGVRGLPDAKRGEVPVAFVVVRDGHTLDGEALRTWSRDHLAPYKVPARVVFKRELPKSLVGKVLRRFLQEDAAPA